MYNKAIKNSIIFFLIAAIISAACFPLSAEAAAIDDSDINIYAHSSTFAVIDNIAYGSSEDGQRNIVTYKYRIDVSLNITPVSGCLQGIYLHNFEMNLPTVNNSIFISRSVSFVPTINSDYLYIINNVNRNISNTNSVNIGVVLNNFQTFTTSSLAIGYFEGLASYSFPYDISPIQTLSVNVINSKSFNNVQVYSEPTNTGVANIIKNSILNALEDTSLGYNNVSVAEYLNLYLQYLYNTMSDVGYIRTAFDNFVTDLFDSWLQGIANNQGYIYTDTQDIRSQLSTLRTYLSNVYANFQLSFDENNDKLYAIMQKLDQIINMGSSQTEGQSEAQDAIDDLASQIDYLDQPTIAISDIFDPVEDAANDHGSDAANIFWWTWDSRITGIMYMVMAFGIIGFVIYGKSG